MTLPARLEGTPEVQVIVNADDLGMSREVNEAIFGLMARGRGHVGEFARQRSRHRRSHSDNTEVSAVLVRGASEHNRIRTTFAAQRNYQDCSMEKGNCGPSPLVSDLHSYHASSDLPGIQRADLKIAFGRHTRQPSRFAYAPSSAANSVSADQDFAKDLRYPQDRTRHNLVAAGQHLDWQRQNEDPCV